jgi:RIO kinase 1
MHNQKPYIIDVGQSVLDEHPLSQEFLQRDIHNIIAYFTRLGIKDDKNKVYEKITQRNGK